MMNIYNNQWSLGASDACPMTRSPDRLMSGINRVSSARWVGGTAIAHRAGGERPDVTTRSSLTYEPEGIRQISLHRRTNSAAQGRVHPVPGGRRRGTRSPLASAARLPTPSHPWPRTPGGPVSRPNSPCSFLPSQSSSASSLQPCLLENAVEGPDSKIVARLPCHCDQTSLHRVLILTVAAPGPSKIPSILLEEINQVPDSHGKNPASGEQQLNYALL